MKGSELLVSALENEGVERVGGHANDNAYRPKGNSEPQAGPLPSRGHRRDDGATY